MNRTMKTTAISLADRLGGALLISLSLHGIAQARLKLRQWRAAA